MTIERPSDWSGPRRRVLAGPAALACALPAAAPLASGGRAASTPGSVEQVRAAPRSVREVDQVIATGYGSQGACVSGPVEGSTADGELRADQPELLIDEHPGGRTRILGAEYLCFVDAWHAAGNTAPADVASAHLNVVNSPNCCASPPFYELRGWVWHDNTKGPFADSTPPASCLHDVGEFDVCDSGH